MSFARDEQGQPMTPGQVAYEAYSNHTDGISAITGARLVPWTRARPDVQAAWEAAAEAAIHEYRQQITDTITRRIEQQT
jgi:hypothetical protein